MRGYSLVTRVENAVMASEIEAVTDRAGFVKFASGGGLQLVHFAYFDVKQQAQPFEPAALGSGSGGGRRWSSALSLGSSGPTAGSGSRAAGRRFYRALDWRTPRLPPSRRYGDFMAGWWLFETGTRGGPAWREGRPGYDRLHRDDQAPVASAALEKPTGVRRFSGLPPNSAYTASSGVPGLSDG